MPLSSPDVQNIIIGGPTQIAVSNYVTAKGAGSFYDVGHSIGGVSFDFKTAKHDIYVDKFLGKVGAEPSQRGCVVKFKMAEGMLKNLSYVLGMDPATYVTGADPNFTFKWNASERAYYNQWKWVGRGLGTNKVRTALAYRCIAGDPSPFEWKKDAEQAFEMQVEICEETTGSGVDSFNVVDS